MSTTQCAPSAASARPRRAHGRSHRRRWRHAPRGPPRRYAPCHRFCVCFVCVLCCPSVAPPRMGYLAMEGYSLLIIQGNTLIRFSDRFFRARGTTLLLYLSCCRRCSNRPRGGPGRKTPGCRRTTSDSHQHTRLNQHQHTRLDQHFCVFKKRFEFTRAAWREQISYPGTLNHGSKSKYGNRAPRPP